MILKSEGGNNLLQIEPKEFSTTYGDEDNIYLIDAAISYDNFGNLAIVGNKIKFNYNSTYYNGPEEGSYYRIGIVQYTISDFVVEDNSFEKL